MSSPPGARLLVTPWFGVSLPPPPPPAIRRNTKNSRNHTSVCRGARGDQG